MNRAYRHGLGTCNLGIVNFDTEIWNPLTFRLFWDSGHRHCHVMGLISALFHSSLDTTDKAMVKGMGNALIVKKLGLYCS